MLLPLAAWLFAACAYSVDLGGDRILWLFGDTFLAREPGGTSSDAYFLRNSAAIQTGRDPSRALMAFHWGADEDGGPRIGDALILFYGRIATPSGDPGGFENVGWRAVVIDDPDDEPSAWTMRDATLPASIGSIYPGTAILATSDFLYAYAENNGGFYDVYLERWPIASAASGDLSAPEWWCGGTWSASCAGDPSVVVPTGAPELSVQPGGTLAPYVMVETEGYDSTTLALRTAAAPEGPWSGPESFFRPPESRDDETDVYAGKAHAGLTGGDLVATYVPANLYFPRFVRVTYR